MVVELRMSYAQAENDDAVTGTVRRTKKDGTIETTHAPGADLYVNEFEEVVEIGIELAGGVKNFIEQQRRLYTDKTPATEAEADVLEAMLVLKRLPETDWKAEAAIKSAKVADPQWKIDADKRPVKVDPDKIVVSDGPKTIN